MGWTARFLRSRGVKEVSTKVPSWKYRVRIEYFVKCILPHVLTFMYTLVTPMQANMKEVKK